MGKFVEIELGKRSHHIKYTIITVIDGETGNEQPEGRNFFWLLTHWCQLSDLVMGPHA